MNHQPNQNDEQKKTIYYDGSCPMCTVIIGKVDDSLQKGKFNPKDITKESLPQNLTKSEVEKEIHLIDSDGKVYKNAEAILKILEEYPRWKFLAKIGRLPVIKQLLPLGYKFIAVNRHFIFGPASRIFWLKIVLVSGLIAGLLLSVKLWTDGRIFPLTPVLDNFPAIPPSIETILFVLLIGLLAAILIFSKPQKFIFTALVIVAIFALFDQMRWQPWFYQYFFMLATLGLFSWNHVDTEKRQAVLNTTRLIVASTYFFSGLQKVNPVFIGGVFPWMIEPIVRFFPAPLQIFPPSLGIIVPFLEMGIGVGLLTKNYRKQAIILALLMLGFVLFTLGPLGYNWNSVVWPWNVAMALFSVILFWRTENFSFRDVLWVKNFPFQKVIFVLFVIMPMLSFFNLWDSYLSSTLYSGNTNSAQIYISDSVKQKLPIEIQRYTTRTEDNRNELDFFHWSFDELNVPPYPETRVYKDIARGICKYASDKMDVVLVVSGKPTLFNGGHRSTYDCSNL
ncbi:MAG: DCC1-like thiol-disulfide oxidoreductase family protein [bacterium]|nr:DCC1-like thiol-disulfide oxidoreductase family protein [bacterium]